MAIIKRTNGTYQARLQGADGLILSRVFLSKAEAQRQDAEWKLLKAGGTYVSAMGSKITVREFFARWMSDHQFESSKSGWRKTQQHYFRDYILPVIGEFRMRNVSAADLTRIFSLMTERDLSPRTQLLVFGTLRKFFGDAIDIYRMLTFNPVIKKLRPKEPSKEVLYLNMDQIRLLLEFVKDKRFGIGIWLQTYLGLRAGELLELRWGDIDLQSHRLRIRRVYVKATKVIRDYPKDRHQRTFIIPFDLLEYLSELPIGAPQDLLINDVGERVTYQTYLRVLESYCSFLRLPPIKSHGLRHSSAILYLTNGASKEDLKDGLFQHSSMKVTERYIHGWNSKIGEVAKVIRLFDKSTTNRPRSSSGSS